jgi:outer membrane protein
MIVRRWNRHVILGVVMVAIAAGTVRGADHPLTLTEAIQRAIENNNEILIGKESLAAATAAVSGAKGAYDPRLEVAGGWQRSSAPVNSSFSGAPEGEFAPTNKAADGSVSIRQLLPTGGLVSVGGRASKETTDGTLALLTPAYGTQVGVELRQPLLRDLVADPARLSVRVARSELQAAAADLRRTVTDAVASVEEAYWALVAARLGQEVRDEAVRLAQEQLGETGTRVESGSVPETELAQPRAELERRTGDQLASREQVSRAENALKLLILGDDDPLWHDRIVPVDAATVEPAPVDVDSLLETALRVRPELQMGEAGVERRRAETAYARNAVWPSLDAVVSYDRFGLAGSRNPANPEGMLPSSMEGDLGQSFEKLGDGDFDAVRVGLVLGFPIRNRTARAAAVSARSVERQAEANLAQVRKMIRAEVLDAAAGLETAGQRITAARAGRDAAQVQLSAERDRYAAGLSTNFLVLTRQNDLSRARLDEISSLIDYRTARTEMARATGSLIEARGIDLGEATP